MPLPRSQLPSYVNQSFLSPGEQQNYSYAQQLFYRYHPSVLQREMFDQLLADEKYKAADAAQKQEILERRLENLDSLLARYREAGVGPSGSAKLATSGIGRGGRGGARGGGAGNNLKFITDGTANEIKRAEAWQKGLGIVEDLMVEADRKPRQYGLFEADFVSKMDRLYGAGGRVHNPCKPEASSPQWRCSVCGTERGEPGRAKGSAEAEKGRQNVR